MLTKKQRIKKISKHFFQRIKGQPEKKTPVFIFGEQRSGTNMLINTLDKSMDTDCYFETDDKAFTNYQLKTCEKIEEIIKNSYGKCVIFKSISDSQKASQILDQFNGAKGIWIYRSYPDVINSSLRNFKDHYRFLELIVKEPEKAAWRAENVTPENMELIAKYYEQKISDASSRALIWYLRNDLFFQQNLKQDHRVLLIKYETLVSKPDTAFKPAFKFMGIDFEDKFIKEIFSGSIKKNVRVKINSEIEELCQNQLKRLNQIMARQI